MKTTIFVRILLATLLPLLLVFVLVISTIDNIIYTNATTTAKEVTAREVTQIARQLSGRLSTMTGYLQVISQGMAEIDYKTPDAASKAEALLHRLLTADPSFSSSWLAFESGVFPGKGQIYQALVKRNNSISTTTATGEALAHASRQSPWHNPALTTKELYIDLTKKYEYGPNKTLRVGPSLALPILAGDLTIGVVGIELSYEDMFDAESFQISGRWQTMLVTGEGQIVYSSNKEHIGQNLLDHPLRDTDKLTNTFQTGTPFMQEAYAPFTGVESLVSLCPIPLKNTKQSLFLYLSAPTEDMYAAAHSSRELIISTSVLGLLLLGFSVFVATRSIVRSVRVLTVNFNKIANGDLDIAQDQPESGVEEQSGVAEIDILQAALSKMLIQINLTHELRLKATEERMEKERILSASQAKSQFFANMSHEIRTPMNAILGIAEILLHNERLSEQERKYINDIKISSDSLLTIINDILDISKLESGKLTMMDNDFNFHQLLHNVCTMVEYLAHPNNLRFVYEADANLPLCLKGDDIRLRQILLNVLSNACKFTAAGSITLQVTQTANTLQFIVSDTGKGISEADLVFLFEPFKRADISSASRIQGTGLGLSICKSLVEMMHGTIDVQSTYGTGSIFTITIPKVLGDETALKEQQKTLRTVYSKCVQILVVDDNEINLSVAEGLLVDLYGIACDLALSGPEAIEKITAKNYTLVLMDHMMPGMDGLETTRHIRDMGGKYATIPIIGFTANAIKGARETMLEAGIDDYITKPINVDDFDAMLSKWIPDNFKIKEKA